MNLKKRRILFIVIWAALLLSGPYTILTNINLDSVLSNRAVLINTFQRITGVVAIILLGYQVLLGGLMDKWVQFLGSKAYRLHVVQGLVAYGFFFVHPILNSLLIYVTDDRIVSSFIPYFTTQRELDMAYGVIGFYLITLAVVAGYFRTRPFFRRNWSKFHYLNYFAFFFSFYHSLKLGTTVYMMPFALSYWIVFTLVSGVFARRVYVTLSNKNLSSLLKFGLRKEPVKEDR